MGVRERLDALSRGEMAALVVVVVVTLAGAGLWYTRSLPKPVQVAAASGAEAPVGASGAAGAVSASGSASPAATAAPVIVDVTGWVRKPGVYEFAAGDRVIDAVERAGGARPGADLTLLNLAAPLTDGTQVVVAKEGAAGATTGSTIGSAGSTAGAGALININTASESELEAINGVGPVTAAAIVQYRTEHGPFETVDDLMDVSGIGPATLEELRSQVTV